MTTVSFGARRVVVARPNDRQYGHLGLEIVMALGQARAAAADVYLVRPSTSLGGGMFELESPDVRVLRPNRLVAELLRACSLWQRLRERLGKWGRLAREVVEREFVREVTRYVTDAAMPQELRETLRRVRGRLRVSNERLVRDRRRQSTYFARRVLREALPVRLLPPAAAEAARAARAIGIDPDARLVCIHAREAGYKRGGEIQDAKPYDGRDDRARNARIESYLAAADYLVERGYAVVRLGDPSMTPLRHPRVIDLATSPHRTNLLEIYCMLRSELLIAGESGLAGVTYLTNTPFLLVNSTEPISSYPVRGPGLFMPKTVIDKRDGRRLTNLDLLSLEYHRQFRDTRRYLYVDNTPAQILDATREILCWIEGAWTESPSQRSYHDSIVAAATELRHSSVYARKWGLDRGFLGDGRIARVALEVQ